MLHSRGKLRKKNVTIFKKNLNPVVVFLPKLGEWQWKSLFHAMDFLSEAFRQGKNSNIQIKKFQTNKSTIENCILTFLFVLK